MDGKKNVDINDIINMAQNISKNIPQDGDFIKNTTESVINMMQNIDESQLNSLTENIMKNLGGTLGGATQEEEESFKPIDGSKISLDDEPKKLKQPKSKNKNYEELDFKSDDEVDVFCPRTKDIEINLNVDLDDFYRGTKKKLAVHRKRLKKDQKGKITQITEKKKIVIPIEPGMRDEQVLRFNREGDEEIGHETGDIVITLYENAHSTFERDGDNLYMVKDISLYESYLCGEKLDILHLDKNILRLNPTKAPLHEKDGLRKIEGAGMPRYKREGRGDLFVRFNLVLPKFVTKENSKILGKIFPPVNQSLVGEKVVNVKLKEVSQEEIDEMEYSSEEDYSDSD